VIAPPAVSRQELRNSLTSSATHWRSLAMPASQRIDRLGLPHQHPRRNDQGRDLSTPKAALGSLECDVVSANSGHDALQCVLAQDFAVIVLDIQMPIMDGFETARLIRERERSRTTPISFSTHMIPTARGTDGYLLGAIDHIYTPVNPHVPRSMTPTHALPSRPRAHQCPR
jgi:CheY-like chemotaxis protein